MVGGFGAEDRVDSGSDRYEESLVAVHMRLVRPMMSNAKLRYSDVPPVSTPTPPVFFNFGMPPANKPPSCGAPLIAGAAGAFRLPWSLLLLALFPGTGGARPPVGLAMPGTGGAPPTGEGPGPPETLPTIGADRSFVTAFFKAFPLLMSESRAP